MQADVVERELERLLRAVQERGDLARDIDGVLATVGECLDLNQLRFARRMRVEEYAWLPAQSLGLKTAGRNTDRGDYRPAAPRARKQGDVWRTVVSEPGTSGRTSFGRSCSVGRVLGWHHRARHRAGGLAHGRRRALPLPHFENEDVDLCGNILTVVNEREAKDLGSIMYVVSIANRTSPSVIAILPLGLTGSGRGSGHIANFVKPDCSQAPGSTPRTASRRSAGTSRVFASSTTARPPPLHRSGTTSRPTARRGPPTGRRPTRTARSSTRRMRTAVSMCSGSTTAD